MISSSEITSPIVSSRKQFDRNETISQRIQNDDARNRETCSARLQKNIVSARSQGHPRINDIAVNDKTLGMTVQPCRIHRDTQKDDQLVTWKQISHKKDNLQADPVVDHNFFQLLDLDRLCNQDERNENRDRIEEDSSIAKNNFIQTDDELKDEIDKVKNDDVTWLDSIYNLNQTYLIKDSEDIESSEIFHSKWKPIRHSPRIEFYFKDREDEICEFEKKSKKEIVVNDEIRIEQVKELKMNIKNEENYGDETMVGYKVKELKTNGENMENNRKTNIEEIEVIACKTEELNINSRNEENKRRVSYEETKATEYNTEKIEINTEDTKETEKMNDADVAELDRLSVYKEDKEDYQITMNKRIESTKYIEETERNLAEPDHLIKSSLLDVVHSTVWNVSKKRSFIDQSQDYLNLKDEISQSNICCNNSLELKESTATFICDQSNIIPLNNSNNQADCNPSPKDETLTCQSNSCRNSLDLTENIKEISFPASSRNVTSKKSCTGNTEETEINEESYENGLTNLYNKKLKKNSKRLNSEVYLLPQNSEIAAGNYLNTSMNNIPLYVKDNRQFRKEKAFSSSNVENIENNTKDRKTDFNVDSDNSCSNDKLRLLGCSIIKTEVTTGEGLRKNNVDSEFDYGSDNTARVRERNARDANDLGSSVTLMDYAEEESRHRGNEIFLNASVNFPRRASDATRRTVRERPVNSVEMKHRIRERMNLLRGSTDSLISSVEFVELASIRRPEANCAYERETIEIIRPNRRSKMSKDLPDIKGGAAETREDSKRSYWERTSKISRGRLTGFYPACHAEYKLAKRNPKVRILPPVPNSPLINRR